MTESEFGERLRNYRKAKHMTQQELAERLGVSDKSVSRWENGSYPDVALLGPLAKELGVTVDDLLGTAPPLRKLERSDLQNWLSFGFAIGGGVLFFLLDLFAPTALCYLIYLGLMIYGVYLQKNYTFHSKWFHVGNLVMNFFVNLWLIGAALPFLVFMNSMSLSELYETWAGFLHQYLQYNAPWGTGLYGLRVFLFFLIQPGVAVALTAVTSVLIRRWQNGTLPPVSPGFSPKNLTLARVLPMLCPVLLGLYWTLFMGDTAILPIWVYQHQGGVFYALWAGLTLLCVLWLIGKRQKGMLVPFAVVQWISLYLPRLCRLIRAIGPETGHFYDANEVSDKYIRFFEGDPAVFCLAAGLAVVYLLCAFVKLWQKPAGTETLGEDTPM